MKLLKHFNAHENIITVIDVMTVVPNSLDFEDVYIVTNLMESDLERIIRSKQSLTDQHYQYFLYQILRALKYVHSANVLHRGELVSPPIRRVTLRFSVLILICVIFIYIYIYCTRLCVCSLSVISFLPPSFFF